MTAAMETNDMNKNKVEDYSGKVPQTVPAPKSSFVPKIGQQQQKQKKIPTPFLRHSIRMAYVQRRIKFRQQSQEIRVELETSDKASNTISTIMSGKLDGNNQTAELVSDGETMQADDQGILHSYSKNVAFTGKIRTGCQNRPHHDRLRQRRHPFQLKNLIDADGNFIQIQ